MKNIINNGTLFPEHLKEEHDLFIFITSFNLGGAERIVADQLWANKHQKQSHNVTLILLYDKVNEHPIPDNVNVIRLKGDLLSGKELFENIKKSNTTLVCHLINDTTCQFLFSLNLSFHLVIHNDRLGWRNSCATFNHKNIISLISVCDHVTKQLSEISNKKIYTVRHQIKNSQSSSFNHKDRLHWREKYSLKNEDIVIGMTGRICQQKNYFLALDVIAMLSRKNPNYKLLILGGFEKTNTDLYFKLLKKANLLKIQKNIVFAGFQLAYQGLYNALDIGLNTSHFEGLSMATQEFIQNGLPFVASNVSGQMEILDIKNQIDFFELPQLETFEYETTTIDNIPVVKNYNDTILKIVDLIEKKHSKRISFSKEEALIIKQVAYGSHNLWSLFHFLPEVNKTENEEIRPLFLTSNLNLGGAQRSLTNLLIEFKKNGYNIPLAVANQSNYNGFYDQIISNNIEHFLCHSEKDVFLIFSNLLSYINQNKINRILLWNIDSKIKLLLSKLTKDFIDIIDVSPGDYCFKEMEDQRNFQEAIYTNKKEYFSSLHSFVSKFDNSKLDHEYKKYIQKETVYIPNGVDTQLELTPKLLNEEKEFRFLVCGRITQSKHIDIILSSFKTLFNDHKKVSIDIYGSCETYNLKYLTDLQEEHEDLINLGKINFKGNIDNPSLIMKNYHAIIVLGTHQGCPNMVLESAANGLLVIANDSGGTKEIIGSDRGILLPETPSQKLLTEAMYSVITNYKIFWKKSLQAKKHIENNFTLNIMFENYKNLIFTK